LADRDKKSGVEILGWVGDVGEVVLWNTFFDRVGVFRDAFGITRIWGGEWGLMNCNCYIFLWFNFGFLGLKSLTITVSPSASSTITPRLPV